MGELLAFSQSSLLLLPKYQLQSSSRGWNSNIHCKIPPSAASSVQLWATKSILSPTFSILEKQFSWGTKASVVSDSKMPATLAVDSAGKEVDVLTDTSGGGDDFGGASGKGGGGGRGDNGNSRDEGASDENEDHIGSSKKKTGMSMSQKLTLGYAVLVGAGGIMGYMKSGSQKSLIAGGVSASLLYVVYTLLPTKSVLASFLGFGLSAALLGVMGSRFKKSGKIFPAGVVSLVSLVMTGGYLHGIMRSAH